MLAPDWTWWTTVPVIVVTVLVLWIPGTVLAKGLGATWWPAVAVAPALTVSLVAVGGIAIDLAGLSWGIGTLLMVGLLLPALVWVARWMLVRSGRRVPRLEVPAVDPRAVVLGVLVAAGVALGVLVTAQTRPGDIPQMPDVISHLGIVRYFLDNGTISSLVADGFNRPSAPGFYPAAFHAVAATLVMLTGAPVVVADTVVLLVASAFVWPVGLIFLVGSLLDARSRTLVATGLVASAALGFPFLLLVYGPLWPLAFSFTLVPAIITLFALAVRGLLAHGPWLVAAVTAVVIGPGLALAHTSAVFVAMVACFVILAAALVSFGRESTGNWALRWSPLVGLLVAGVVGVVALAYVAPEGMKNTNYGHFGWRKALAGLVTLWSRREDTHQVASILLLALMVVGAVVAFRTRGARWLAVTWLWFLGLAFANSAIDATVTWPLTWPWYNVPVRTQAVATLFGLPLAALGVSALIGAAVRLPRGGRVAAGLMTAVVAVLVGVQAWAISFHLDRYYVLFTPERARLLPEEAAALEELSDVLPDEAVVATSPWKGGQFLPAIGPEQVLIPTETAVNLDPDMMLIGTELDGVLEDPQVCAAVQREGVTHVITGGRETWNAAGRTAPYEGIEDISQAEGFTPVVTAGPYTLWQMPTCQE